MHLPVHLLDHLLGSDTFFQPWEADSLTGGSNANG
jgi:hypothetical protein